MHELESLCEQAGEAILQQYGRDGGVVLKADDSPLTLADQAAHEILEQGLRRLFPDIPVLSEESAPGAYADRADWPVFWLVDPLDGTKDFLKQTGCFTVNIALIEEHEPTLGLIHVPAKGLTYGAAKGQGSWRREGHSGKEKISCVAPDLRAPRIVASRDHAGPEVAALLARFPGHHCLSIGSSLKFCLVAEGKADVYLRDVPTMEWDVAAAHVIVREAGGEVIDLSTDRPLRYNKTDLRNPSLLTHGRSSPNDWLP